MKFTASRLSEGNKVFPSEIHIEQTGVTVKIPGFFKGDSKFFDYQHIASVDVKAPMIGYSTITFYAGGTQISAHGFTSGEVKQIKQAIEDGKMQSQFENSYSKTNSDQVLNSNLDSAAEVQIAKSYAEATKAKADAEAMKAKAQADATKAKVEFASKLFGMDDAGRNKRAEARGKMLKGFGNLISGDEKKLEKVQGKIEEVSRITFGTTSEEIQNTLSQLTAIANSKPDSKVKAAIAEKMEFGIMKLKSIGATAEADFFERKLEPLKKKGWF